MERGKLDKGGYSSISGPRVIEKAFNDMSISGSRFGSGSGLGGLSADMDSFASKPKGEAFLSAGFFDQILFRKDTYCIKLW
jgi:hypothetical protein